VVVVFQEDFQDFQVKAKQTTNNMNKKKTNMNKKTNKNKHE